MDSSTAVRVASFALACALVGLGGCTAKKAVSVREDAGMMCDQLLETKAVPVDLEAGQCGDTVAGTHVLACGEVYSAGCGSSSLVGRCCASITEGCDGADLRGETCGSLGFASGELSCSDCVLDATGCHRCDPTQAAACSSLSPPPGDTHYPQIASWRDQSLLWIGEHVHPVDRSLERGDALEVGPVVAMAPLGRLGILLAHRTDEGEELEISAWRGGTRLQRGAVDLKDLVRVTFLPVSDRPGWLFVSGRRAGSMKHPAYLLDPRGMWTEVAAGEVEGAFREHQRLAAGAPENAPFRAPGLLGDPSPTRNAAGRAWTYWTEHAPLSFSHGGALLTHLQSSKRRDGVLWLSYSTWEPPATGGSPFGDTNISLDGSDDGAWSHRGVSFEQDCRGEDLPPLPAVVDMPVELELAFVPG